MNPEFRQTLQHFTRNLESANEAAQQNIYSFTQTYIDPCISSIKSCAYECTAPCFPGREDQLRRKRGRSRGRADFDFDFYDDWDEDVLGESSGLGWSTGELDGLLAGRGSSQPRRQRAMSYGARLRRDEVESDPNVIPKSSYLGFLERWPFNFGKSGTRYKPSAANLEENPGGLRIRDVESSEPLLSEDVEATYQKGHSRQRSGTEVSYSTTTSRSSRGDLIMSDEEDDAVPLDDEFAAVMLSRRNTNTGFSDDHTNGKRRSGGGSRISSRTVSTRSIESPGSPRLINRKLSKSSEVSTEAAIPEVQGRESPTLRDLKEEEEQLRQLEELDIAQKREAAQKLAQSMGLNTEVKSPNSSQILDRGDLTPVRNPTRQNTGASYFALASPTTPLGETEPFPNIQSPMSPRSPSSTKDKSGDHPP